GRATGGRDQVLGWLISSANPGAREEVPAKARDSDGGWASQVAPSPSSNLLANDDDQRPAPFRRSSSPPSSSPFTPTSKRPVPSFSLLHLSLRLCVWRVPRASSTSLPPCRFEFLSQALDEHILSSSQHQPCSSPLYHPATSVRTGAHSRSADLHARPCGSSLPHSRSSLPFRGALLLPISILELYLLALWNRPLSLPAPTCHLFVSECRNAAADRHITDGAFLRSVCGS
ncbi:hypothetical protein FKP32DRAFT_1627003, partial [Trametes sanguinea]